MNYFKTMFGLQQFHHRTLADLEGMIPWEFDVYLVMLFQHQELERQKAMEQQAQARVRK